MSTSYPVVILPAAQVDVSEIVAGLEERAGIATAEKYARVIAERGAMLQDFPLSGSLRSNLGPNMRATAVRPYIVSYEFDDEVVYFHRVMHSRRNITPEAFGS